MTCGRTGTRADTIPRVRTTHRKKGRTYRSRTRDIKARRTDLVGGAALERVLVVFFYNLHRFGGGFPPLLRFVLVVRAVRLGEIYLFIYLF